jgi:homoserine O-acetyltransferase
MPGSCYGSLGPLSENPATGQPYFHDFPFFTPRDMVRAYQPLKKELGIERIKIGIGGSMGGQQLLEWAIEEPGLFEFIFPIATNAWHSAWGIAFNASQRACIETDLSWVEKRPDAGIEGMKTARSVALLSYRHYETYRESQQEEDLERLVQFRSESYQRYQGEKLAIRFNAFSYYKLSQSMDAHQVGRGRNNPQQALQRIRSKALVIGIDTDILFPLTEQQFITSYIQGASLVKIHSRYGHDGFLLEYEQIGSLIGEFIQLKTHSSVKFASSNSENGST